jgi:hypothetical protein
MKIKNKKIIKYLIWLLIFLFLPSMNGCQPSIGYPFSSAVNHISHHSATSIIVKFILNSVIYIFIIKFIIKYFNKHKIQLRILSYYAIYEATISLIILKVPKVEFLNFLYIGQLTLSWWTNLGIFIIIDADESKHQMFLYHITAFISMLSTTLILYIITLVIEKLIVINMKLNELNKANSP